MSEIFGKGPRHESDNENPFVVNQTRVEDEKENEVEDQPVENQPQEPQTGQAEVSDQESETETAGQSDEEAQSNGKLAGKFNDRGSLLEGVKNLGSKLGRKVDPVKVGNATNGDLEEIYQQLEKELGQTSDVDKTRQENQQLKEQLNQYEQQLRQTQAQMTNMQRYLQRLSSQQPQGQQQQMNQNQNVNQPQNQNMNNQRLQRDPQTGRFQQNQQADNQQQQDVDPTKWLREFYKNPVEAIKKINNMSDSAQQQVKNNMNQQEIQQFNNQQRQMQQNQLTDTQRYRQQLNQESQQFFAQKRIELENKYEDFKDPEVKKDVVKYMQNHKAYLNPRLFPNGLEKAYLEVKKMRENRNTAANQEQTNEQLKQQKQAAQLPHSKGSNVREPGDPNSAEATKDRIFGGGGSIFGR